MSLEEIEEFIEEIKTRAKRDGHPEFVAALTTIQRSLIKLQAVERAVVVEEVEKKWEATVDSLERLWSRQLAFTKKFIDPATATEEEKMQCVKETCLNIISEIDEMLTAAGPWKQHTFQQEAHRRSGILEESIDIFKYLLNIPQAYGFDSKQFLDEFHRKSTVVEQKYEQDQMLRDIDISEVVVGVDIDGVLAQYPEYWIDFINKELKTAYTLADVRDISHTLPEIPRDVYTDLKFKYREEGQNRTIPLAPYAKEFLDRLRERSFKIILLSRRPYKIHKRIFGDTLEWLKEHELPFDAIIWSAKKHEELLLRFPSVAFMVEDEPRAVEEIASWEISCFMPTRPYNEDYVFSASSEPHVFKVENLQQILLQQGLWNDE